MAEDLKNPFAIWLEQFLGTKNISSEELANKVGASPEYVINIIAGLQISNDAFLEKLIQTFSLTDEEQLQMHTAFQATLNNIRAKTSSKGPDTDTLCNLDPNGNHTATLIAELIRIKKQTQIPK